MTATSVSSGQSLRALPLQFARNPGEIGPAAVFAVMFALALALRFSMLGNPDIHVDEEFYFAVADRMWRGDLPYVDVWDRKPIGLFLIYAALRPFSGDGMVAIQIAGHLFTAATALVIWDLTRENLGRWKALMPAALYVLWMGPFGGANGQSPVFHNLFVAVAFWLLTKCWRETERRELLTPGLIAMTLIGLAIQVKYTPVFPGLVFGLGFAWLEWCRNKRLDRLAARASLWAGAALLPTMLAFAYYAVQGHAETFIFANFTSIFLREPLDPAFLDSLKIFMAARGAPLFLVAAVGAVLMTRLARPAYEPLLVLAWLAAEMFALALIGNYYDHYALPLIPPLTVMTAQVFARPGGMKYVIFGLLVATSGIPDPRISSRDTERSRAAISTLTEAARPYLRDGCMFIFDGPSILYSTTGSCTLTRFVYPDHLSNSVEADALGTDSVAEMRRVMSNRPTILVTSTRGLIPVWNGQNRRIIDAAIVKDYRLIAYALEGFGSRYYLMWARADLVPPGTTELPTPSQAALEKRYRDTAR